MKYSIFNSKVNKKSDELKKDYTPIIILSILIVVVIVVFIVISTTKNNKCKTMEDNVMEEAYNYAVNNNLLPTDEGKSVTININKLTNTNFEIGNKTCTGNVKITKADDKYIKTFDLKNCSYCTTEKRYTMSNYQEKYPENKKLIDVKVSFNYYEVTKNYTAWTNWYEGKYINTETSEWGINLPIDEQKLPKIPSPGELITYETEKKTVYSYRNQEWKFYSNNNTNYSDFSSEQPAGYANKDINTAIESEPSEWSSNYPEVKSYRKISSSIAYKWYYEDDKGNKIYYNKGNYIPSIENEEDKAKYTKRDSETITMYRYVDTLWRWYNGVERKYSSYYSLPSKTYPYKDEALTKYTSWSSWSEKSSITEENKSYRQEKTDIQQRYRAYFMLHSNEVFDKYLSREEFEKQTGKTVEELKNDESVKVLVKYEYNYGK